MNMTASEACVTEGQSLAECLFVTLYRNGNLYTARYLKFAVYLII
jgi:hypothetical protein